MNHAKRMDPVISTNSPRFESRHVRSVVLAVMTCLLMLSLTACGTADGGEEANGGEEADLGAIAMSFGGADVPIWNSILDEMRPTIEEAGYEFLTHDPQWDVSNQAADWDTWLARGDLAAIMGFPIQVEALRPVSQRIVEEEVPLLGYGQSWEETSAAFLTDGFEDGQDLGEATGEWIAEEHGDDADIEVVTFVSRDDDLSASRADGYEAGLKAVAPNVKIREVSALTRQDGYDGTKAALTANPDIKVWIGAEGATLGAHQALTEGGVAPDDPEYFLGALDLTNESLDLLKKENGIFRTGFVFRPSDVAAALSEMLLTAAAGDEVEDVVLGPSQATAENADEFYTE